ncbi:MAG: hypothetical protein CVV64_11415 [Candidatus Wallbacteria bacterium HGW-Wallbacteria-1]|uniref:Uncharacterized protein n=1 Tax=Candidatus Wallbacteria bacterium HGW-Wallbacteria-1 TaxID=2013854 RepID=A0A2N1PNM0_9BACT|nr:MAG: hypothetical protein CVV64_11415 [Candidatus Wallbacteria bacterium HGW-Wallbacteria-1]
MHYHLSILRPYGWWTRFRGRHYLKIEDIITRHCNFQFISFQGTELFHFVFERLDFGQLYHIKATRELKLMFQTLSKVQ